MIKGETVIKNLDKKIGLFEEYMNEVQMDSKFVGTSIAFVYENDIIYSKGFGKARLNPEKEITPNTIMSIQSITKSFASTAIMHLVEKNLIDLDKPLVEYLPYFKTLDKSESDKITVRQLLSHTAGLPNCGIANIICSNRKEFTTYEEWKKEVGVTDEEIESIKSFEDITRYFSKLDLSFNPGEDWAYSTDAYAIVGDLFEKVSGSNWHEYIQSNIFDKLNMARTTLNPSIVKNDEDSGRFYITIDGKIEEVPFPTNPIAAPIGFIYSSAIDMAKYLSIHMNYDNNPLLLVDSIKEMQKPYGNVEVNLPISGAKDIGYGLGWAIGIYKKLNLVEHGGGYLGVRSNVSMIPSEKLGVVVLTNYNEANPIEICHKALDILLEI